MLYSVWVIDEGDFEQSNSEITHLLVRKHPDKFKAQDIFTDENGEMREVVSVYRQGKNSDIDQKLSEKDILLVVRLTDGEDESEGEAFFNGEE